MADFLRATLSYKPAFVQLRRKNETPIVALTAVKKKIKNQFLQKKTNFAPYRLREGRESCTIDRPRWSAARASVLEVKNRAVDSGIARILLNVFVKTVQ